MDVVVFVRKKPWQRKFQKEKEKKKKKKRLHTSVRPSIARA
jgi:hypothetical protein